MSASFKDKVAVITGGTKGIGAATATAIVKAKGKVVINYGRDTESADKLVAELGADNVLAVQADAGSLSGIEKIIQATVEKFFKIDILIPNAGVLPMKTVEATTEEDFDRTFALNVKGPYFLVQKALPYLSPKAHIILISTTLNYSSGVMPGYTLYCATKGAIDQMTRCFARDLATKDISVNAIAPGPTGTELFLTGKSEQLLKMMAGASPYNRIGAPDEIASAILFMASSDSKWVCGQTLRVNGGSVV